MLAWIKEVYPLILVLFDATQDRAYWLSIQNYFADKQAFSKMRGKTVTIPIPAKNVMSEKAMREFARWKSKILA